MSNWIGEEFEKFQAWVRSHLHSAKERVDALEARVDALEKALEERAAAP